MSKDITESVGAVVRHAQDSAEAGLDAAQSTARTGLDAAQSTARSGFDAAGSATRGTMDEFDRGRAWGRSRPQIGIGAAAVLALGASVATAIFVRRRTKSRMGGLAWLALRLGMMAAIPSLRRSAPVGGAGSALLTLLILLARARRARAHKSRMDELSERLAALQAQADARLLSDRPRPRDVLLGVGVGLGVAGLLSRRAARQSN
jgi:hypothetical protein